MNQADQADLEPLIEPHLLRKERIRWAARPSPQAFVSLVSYILPIFGLFFVGGLGFAAFSTAQAGGPWFVPVIFGAPFWLIGLFTLRLPFLELEQGRKVIYAVTNERALIIREGRPAVVKAYRAAAFVPFDVSDKSIIFAGDSNLDGFMPGHRGQVARAIGHVGFVGLTPEEVEKARKHLQALKEAPEDIEDLIDSRRGSNRALIYEMAGPYAALREKLETWVSTHMDVEGKRQIKDYGGCLWGAGAVALLVLAFSIYLAVTLRDAAVFGTVWAIAGPFVVMIALSAVGVFVAFRFFYGVNAHRQPAALATLDKLDTDRHPDAHLYGWLDLGDVTSVRPVRMKNSPHSHALKTYHKHHWGRFATTLADGNHLAVSLIDKVKLKSGFEVSRRHFVRGRLTVNPAHYDVARLTEPLGAGALTAVPQTQGDRTVLYFGGTLTNPNELFTELTRLYRALPRRGDRP